MDDSDSFPVALARCTSYENFQDEDILDLLLSGLMAGYSLAGKKILLKPNLVSGRAPVYACTDGRFIRAVSLWFIAQGAEVVLGDSPAFGAASAVCNTLGITKLIEDLNVSIVDFDRTIEVTLDCGVRVKVAAEVLECDLFVNLPKIKAHSQMYVTLAVKNCFGIISGMQKGLLHMRYGDGYKAFSEIILDLQKIIPRQLIIADGIEVMHHDGPIRGEKLFLGCVGAAEDALAFDTAMLSVLGVDPWRSPLWKEAYDRAQPQSFISNISFPLLMPEAFKDISFVAPDTLTPVRFNPLRFAYGMLRKLFLHQKS